MAKTISPTEAAVKFIKDNQIEFVDLKFMDFPDNGSI